MLFPQVVNVHSNKDFHLLEVIPASVNGNGTITTAAEVNKLQSHHRRTRRSTSVDVDFAKFEENSGRIKVQ